MDAWNVPVATVVVCVVIPYIVNLCKNQNWSANVKRWLAIAFSLVGGIAVGFISGAPTPETFVTWILAIVGGVQVAYAAFKTIGVTSGWLDALEGVGAKTDTTSGVTD